MTQRSLVSLLICTFALLASAEDWPRFLGPGGAGVSAEQVPVSWSETQNIRWKKDLPGPGNSSPIVSGENSSLPATPVTVWIAGHRGIFQSCNAT